jgi:hypothetical protein
MIDQYCFKIFCILIATSYFSIELFPQIPYYPYNETIGCQNNTYLIYNEINNHLYCSNKTIEFVVCMKILLFLSIMCSLAFSKYDHNIKNSIILITMIWILWQLFSVIHYNDSINCPLDKTIKIKSINNIIDHIYCIDQLLYLIPKCIMYFVILYSISYCFNNDNDHELNIKNNELIIN